MNISELTLLIGGSSSNTNNAPEMSRSVNEAGPSQVKETDKASDFSRIEDLIKGNSFSKDEIRNLVEILNSRVEAEPRNYHSPGVDGRQVSLMHDTPMTPAVDKQQDLDRHMVGTLRENRDVPVGVGASPIEIARAFMAARNTEQSQDPYSLTSKIERNQMSNDFARSSLLQSPSVKSSTCWPGAMVQDHHAYTTPQSQRTKYMFRDFPRTPYSRTNLSKSATKLQTDNILANTSTPLQQSRTSIFGQAGLRSEMVDGYGSLGPIRRSKNRFATDLRPRGSSIFLNSPKVSSSKVTKPGPFSGFLPSAENNVEPGETSGSLKNRSTDSVLGSSDVEMREPTLLANQAVKKILEDLDRKKPTPKEKEEELKLATAWRKSSAPGNSNISSMHVGESSSTKITGVGVAEIPAERTKTSSLVSSVSSVGQFQARGVENNEKATGSLFADFSRTPGSNVLPPFGAKRSSEPAVNNLHESYVAATNKGPKEPSFSFAPRHPDNVPDIKSAAGPTNSEPSKNHGSKPSLSSISVNRPYPHPVSSDNGPGFSFPVSPPAGGVSEPPTPSFLPASTQVGIHGVPTVPSYTFGTKESSRLVFSFPSTSNASAPNEASDLKFTFGSDKKTRLAFGAFGKDSSMLLT